MTDTKLKSYVDRIEKLEEEQRAIGVDKRAVYDEVKDAGHNTKALRKIIAERRQKDRAEIVEAMDGYRVALGMAVEAVRDGMSLDDAEEQYGFSRSAIHRESHRTENALSGTGIEMTEADLGEPIWWLIEPPREMTADDLGDPLLITNPWRAKVKAIANSVKRIPLPAAGVPAAPVISDGDGSKSCGVVESRNDGTSSHAIPVDECMAHNQQKKTGSAGAAPGPQDTDPWEAADESFARLQAMKRERGIGVAPDGAADPVSRSA